MKRLYHMKRLYWKHGRIPGWMIDGKGNLHCEYDGDYKATYRITGRKGKHYRQAQLLANGGTTWFYIHRLMAFSWLRAPDSPLRYIVDHQNGDSLCNRVENLRWVTVTANNLNKQCHGLKEENGVFFPRVAGYTHKKYGTADLELAQTLRKLIVECYVRYNCRNPTCGSEFPHNYIHLY